MNFQRVHPYYQAVAIFQAVTMRAAAGYIACKFLLYLQKINLWRNTARARQWSEILTG
jgi:hypothetical protein